ncbi:hypothetical protein MKZ38_004858 [Zalerion maritima]|uniref:Uncharacterized protein n=1 Tax=Zalerion maritima TaxID=339359 RepID=A0AAD5RLG8_9PEZI|nr:hypothetical protein MKZ38_004858 [Zalerion maritima]
MCKRCSKIQEAVEAAGNSTPRGTQEDDESQHDHIMSPITATVSHAMRGKSKANMPVEKQYSDLWSLIFPPGTRSPPSPFIDSILLPRSLRPYRPFLARSIPGLIPPMRKQKDVFFRVLGCKDSPEPNEDDMRIFNNSLLDLLGQVMWEAEQEMCPAAQGTPEKTKVQDSKSPDSSFITLLGDSPLETSMTYDAALAVDPPEDKPNLGDLEGGGISHLPAARGGLERQITSPEVNVHGVWATLDAGSVSFGHHGQAMGGSFAQGD